MTAKTIAIVGLLLTIIPLSTIYAQTAPSAETTDTASFKRFFTSVQFGTGNASTHTFKGNFIRDQGHSLFSGMLITNIDIGYALTKNLVLISGFHSQNQSLQFTVNEDKYRFNGTRHQVPLGVRMYPKHNRSFHDFPMQLFIDFGVYYAFNSDGTLNAEDADLSIDGAFNTFGGMGSIGVLFFENNRSGVTIAYNIFADLTGANARVGGGYFTLGLQSNF
ncbi:MAG: hypothetical protein LAT54_00765 [Cryomorphaceae bacterium]|nr:hypothetical protein [Cryomorphaceae bacterium]